MSVQSSASSPAGKSVAAAMLGLLLTLVLLVVVVLAFLVAPLLLLGVAFLGYLVLRPRPERELPGGTGDPLGSSPVSTHGFGAGVR